MYDPFRMAGLLKNPAWQPHMPMWAQPGQQAGQNLPNRWGDILPYPIKRLRGK